MVRPVFCFFFFFNDTATTEIYTLSLHDALPIFGEVLLSTTSWKSAASYNSVHLVPGTSGRSTPHLRAPGRKQNYGAIAGIRVVDSTNIHHVTLKVRDGAPGVKGETSVSADACGEHRERAAAGDVRTGRRPGCNQGHKTGDEKLFLGRRGGRIGGRPRPNDPTRDLKSTRLNSSHGYIPYAA